MPQTPRTIVITGCSSGFDHNLALTIRYDGTMRMR